MKGQSRESIKAILNKNIKLIKLSYVGIKADEKKIGIEGILQSLSREISVPSIEKFNFFDFENARENIKSGGGSDEFKTLKLDRIDIFEQEFFKLRNILSKINNIKSVIDNKVIMGKYKTLGIIYTKDLIKIEEKIEKIKQLKEIINKDEFGEGMTALIDAFKYKIRGELKRHKIEENKDVEELLERCFKDLQNSNNYINRINLNCNYIVDLSEEILTNRKFLNSLGDMNLADEEKNLIREYAIK